MDVSKFHNTLDKDSSSEQDTDQVQLEEPEEIMDTFFSSMHSARKGTIIDQGNMVCFSENASNNILK